jgi:hypothetical protein
LAEPWRLYKACDRPSSVVGQGKSHSTFESHEKDGLENVLIPYFLNANKPRVMTGTETQRENENVGFSSVPVGSLPPSQAAAQSE